MPFLKDAGHRSDRALHWLFGDSWAVRKGAWKLTGKDKKALTLVNLEADLGEKINRLKEQPELVDELTKLHRQWIEAVGSK